MRTKRKLAISIHSPHARGDLAADLCTTALTISIHSPHARGDRSSRSRYSSRDRISIHSPHARGDAVQWAVQEPTVFISIHSPHARGDSINLQKSFWIQGSLYNKNITAHFSKTLKPFYGLKSSCFGCEASRKVMTASPSHGFSEDASHHSMI